MRRSIRSPGMGWLAFLVWLTVSTAPALANQHNVDAIISALRSPISPQAVTQAREADDKIMAGGDIEGVHVYLVTDERSVRVNRLVTTLLRAAGQNPSEWVVRVLDTDPMLINAFVMGGKYVYIYTGLLAENPSEDVMAFILSHELGHSLLKHQERQSNDASTTWAGVFGLAALLSNKNADALSGIATAITNSYGRGDEEEADAMGCCIAHRAGYDPLRGADFFTRFKREDDDARQHREAQLAEAKASYDQTLSTCLENKKLFESSVDYQTKKNADKVNAMCADAEQKSLAYNKVIEEYNAAAAEEQRNVLLSTHPQDQSRVAAIAAITDFLSGRRDVTSLSKFQQSSRVIAALQQTDSELLKPGVVAPSTQAASDTARAASKPSLEEQLKQLKSALDQGLITQQEYDSKRRGILERY